MLVPEERVDVLQVEEHRTQDELLSDINKCPGRAQQPELVPTLVCSPALRCSPLAKMCSTPGCYQPHGHMGVHDDEKTGDVIMTRKTIANLPVNFESLGSSMPGVSLMDEIKPGEPLKVTASEWVSSFGSNKRPHESMSAVGVSLRQRREAMARLAKKKLAATEHTSAQPNSAQPSAGHFPSMGSSIAASPSVPTSSQRAPPKPQPKPQPKQPSALMLGQMSIFSAFALNPPANAPAPTQDEVCLSSLEPWTHAPLPSPSQRKHAQEHSSAT